MRKSGVYYLMVDIITTFSAKTQGSLVSALNNHLISKKACIQILKNEVSEKNPRYSILRGVLILQNNFLRSKPQSAFYEVIEIINELQYCFKEDKRKTIKNLSAQTLLRLFATLYFELIFMPLPPLWGKEYIDRFKKVFTREDIIETIIINDFNTRYIFQEHGIDLGLGEESRSNLKIILDKFYLL